MLGPISTSAGWAGMGFMATVGGIASDKFGRKNVVAGVSALSTALYVAIMFVESYMMYTILWTIVVSIGIARYQAMMTYSGGCN